VIKYTIKYCKSTGSVIGFRFRNLTVLGCRQDRRANPVLAWYTAEAYAVARNRDGLHVPAT